MPDLDPLAAAGHGVSLHRLTVVPEPGSHVAELVGGLFDGSAWSPSPMGPLPGGRRA